MIYLFLVKTILIDFRRELLKVKKLMKSYYELYLSVMLRINSIMLTICIVYNIFYYRYIEVHRYIIKFTNIEFY